CGDLASSPEARAGCGKSARPDLWRGAWVTTIPTPTRCPSGAAWRSARTLAGSSWPCSVHPLRIARDPREACARRGDRGGEAEERDELRSEIAGEAVEKPQRERRGGDRRAGRRGL